MCGVGDEEPTQTHHARGTSSTGRKQRRSGATAAASAEEHMSPSELRDAAPRLLQQWDACFLALQEEVASKVDVGDVGGVHGLGMLEEEEEEDMCVKLR